MLKKFSSKLIVYFIILMSVLVITVFFMTESLIKKSHINLIRSQMATETEIINAYLQEKSILQSTSTHSLKNFAKPGQIRITIIRPDGVVLTDTDVDDVSSLDNHYYRKEIYGAIHNGTGESIRYSNTVKTDMLYYAKNFNSYILRLAVPLHSVNSSVKELKKITALTALGVFLLSTILIIIITLKITAPFNETLNFANNFAKGDYKKRILNYNDDEIGTLQRALNKMADTIVETINAHVLEKKKLETTIESINDGLAMIDTNKKILVSNSAFSEQLGISEEPKNKPYFEIIRNRTINSRIENALKSGEKDFFEAELLNEKIFNITLNPIKEDDKNMQGTLLVLHDISEKKKIEKIKSDLVTNVSHELKTPITIVKGYLETIKENPDNKEMMNDFIERAIENVDRQNALIQDIIKLSMIESSMEFEKEEINLRKIILNCIDIVMPKLNKKQINIKTEFPEKDYNVIANSFLAEEIFFNLIDNAIFIG